ncbi:hypothetical protein ADUPG1_012104, partial [Aduncisulcus paluster]
MNPSEAGEIISASVKKTSKSDTKRVKRSDKSSKSSVKRKNRSLDRDDLSEDSRVGAKSRLFVLKSDDCRPPRGEDFVHQLKDVTRDAIVEFCQKCLEAVNSDHTLVLQCLGSLIKDDVSSILSLLLPRLGGAGLAVTLDQITCYALEWKRLVKKHFSSKWIKIQRKRAATAFIRGRHTLSFSEKVMEDVDDLRRYGVTQSSDDPSKPVINSDDMKGAYAGYTIFIGVPILPTSSSSISFFQIPNSLIKKDLLSEKGERVFTKTIRRLRKRSDCGEIAVYSSKEVEVEKTDFYPLPPPPPPLYPSTMVVGVDPGRAALAGVAILSCSPSGTVSEQSSVISTIIPAPSRDATKKKISEEVNESENFDESEKSTSDGKDEEEKEEVTITTTKSVNNHAAHGGSRVKPLRGMKTMTSGEIQSDETLKLTVIDPGSASKPANGIFIEKLKSVGSEQFRAFFKCLKEFKTTYSNLYLLPFAQMMTPAVIKQVGYHVRETIVSSCTNQTYLWKMVDKAFMCPFTPDDVFNGFMRKARLIECECERTTITSD